MDNEIIEREFTRKSKEFITDADIDYLATLAPWIDSEFVEERKRYLRKWRDMKATKGLALKALTHANEYAHGTTGRLLVKHPELREKLLRPAYLKALEIADLWITRMIEQRKTIIGW